MRYSLILVVFLFNLFVYPYFIKGDIQNCINLFEKKRYKEAEKCFKKEIKNNKKIAYIYLSKIYWKTGKLNKAINTYNKLIKDYPTYTGSYNDLAMIYLEKGNIEKGINILKTGIKRNPFCGLCYYNIATLYLKLKKYGESEKNYKKALIYIKEKETLSDIYLGLGRIYRETSKPAKALEYFLKAYEYNNKNWKAVLLAGNIYYQQEDYNEAINYFRKAIELKPGIAQVYFLTGNAYRGIRDYNNMLKYYKLALKYNPGYKECLYELANYYAFIGKKEKFFMTIKKLVSLDRKYKDIILNNRFMKKYKNEPEFQKVIEGGK